MVPSPTTAAPAAWCSTGRGTAPAPPPRRTNRRSPGARRTASRAGGTPPPRPHPPPPPPRPPRRGERIDAAQAHDGPPRAADAAHVFEHLVGALEQLGTGFVEALAGER